MRHFSPERCDGERLLANARSVPSFLSPLVRREVGSMLPSLGGFALHTDAAIAKNQLRRPEHAMLTNHDGCSHDDRVHGDGSS